MPELAFCDMFFRAGTSATLVAQWAGHTVEVLLRTYAHCIEGDDRWFGPMDDALGRADQTRRAGGHSTYVPDDDPRYSDLQEYQWLAYHQGRQPAGGAPLVVSVSHLAADLGLGVLQRRLDPGLRGVPVSAPERQAVAKLLRAEGHCPNSPADQSCRSERLPAGAT
jgi:hypothetical protein